jgi:hypothetical protein
MVAHELAVALRRVDVRPSRVRIAYRHAIAHAMARLGEPVLRLVLLHGLERVRVEVEQVDVGVERLAAPRGLQDWRVAGYVGLGGRKHGRPLAHRVTYRAGARLPGARGRRRRHTEKKKLQVAAYSRVVVHVRTLKTKQACV